MEDCRRTKEGETKVKRLHGWRRGCRETDSEAGGGDRDVGRRQIISGPFHALINCGCKTGCSSMCH